MPNKKIVLDTNCLLVSISKYGEAYPVWRGFLDGRYTLCVSTDILEEYESCFKSVALDEKVKNFIQKTPFKIYLINNNNENDKIIFSYDFIKISEQIKEKANIIGFNDSITSLFELLNDYTENGGCLQ